MQTVHISRTVQRYTAQFKSAPWYTAKKAILHRTQATCTQVHRTYSFSGERVHQVLHLCKAKVHLLKATVHPCHAKVNIFQYTAQASTPQNSDDHNYSKQNSITVHIQYTKQCKQYNYSTQNSARDHKYSTQEDQVLLLQLYSVNTVRSIKYTAVNS